MLLRRLLFSEWIPNYLLPQFLCHLDCKLLCPLPSYSMCHQLQNAVPFSRRSELASYRQYCISSLLHTQSCSYRLQIRQAAMSGDDKEHYLKSILYSPVHVQSSCSCNLPPFHLKTLLPDLCIIVHSGKPDLHEEPRSFLPEPVM